MQLTQKQYDKLLRYATHWAERVADFDSVKEFSTMACSAKVGDMNLIEVMGDEE